MTYNTRAALAAIATLALCACTTTETMMGTKAPAADIKTAGESMVEAAVPVDISAEIGAQETAAQKENLLYGAMTKYELMSFVEAMNGADLQGALEGEAPVTVFAPNNQAFEYANLGADVDMPAILKGHIIEGAMDAAALKAAVAENGAPVEITTSSGTKLTVYVMADKVRIAGPSGSLASITQADMRQSNGVMHQISSVLLPK